MSSDTKGEDVAESKEKSFEIWYNDLYNVDDVTNEELISWHEQFAYKGFNRREVLIEFMKLIPNKKIATQIIIACALRGPRRAAETKLIDGRTISSLGIPASAQKGKKGLSCQRIMAATADLAAYYLKKLGVQKRIDIACPAWLQFPSAGAIKLPNDLRQQHMDFSRKFSTLIGGAFNEQIYDTMSRNSYLSNSLEIMFEDSPVLPTSSATSSSSSVPANIVPNAPSALVVGASQTRGRGRGKADQ